MAEPDKSRPIALVTGASSGIGRDFCTRLAFAGHALVLVARDRAAMETLAADLSDRYGTQSLVLPSDLAAPGAAARIMDAIAERGLEIELLINNAGFGKQGDFQAVPAEDITGMVMVNVLAATELARLMLPGMIARGHGRILNVASIAAFLPGPMMAVYYASKAYLLSLSEALWEETRGTGVTVTALCPGPTESDFFRRAGMGGVGSMPMARSEEVVRLGYDAMIRGDRIVIPGTTNRLATFATRFAPKSLMLRQVRRLQSGRRPKSVEP